MQEPETVGPFVVRPFFSAESLGGTIMKTRFSVKRPTLRKLVSACLIATTLAGCASPVKRNDDLGGLRQGPGNTPQRNVTDFTSALRCMDETLFAFGTRDVVFLLEEMRDESRRLGVGT